MSAVYTAADLAELTGVSEWSIYQHRADFPVPFIRVDRRIVWPKAPVDQLLGLTPRNSEEQGTTPAPSLNSLSTGATVTKRKVTADGIG